MSCWQVGDNPLTVYLAADGRPVPTDATLDPWLASPPCWTLEGQPVAPVAVLRRKLFVNGAKDHPADPKARTPRTASGGRRVLQPDPMHLVRRHARYLEARLPASLQQKRAAVLDALGRAIDHARFLASIPTEGPGTNLVISGEGFIDVFRPGPMPGTLALQRCSDRTSAKRSCQPGCAQTACRPPYAEIESLQPAATAAEQYRWAESLVSVLPQLVDHLEAWWAPTGEVPQAVAAVTAWVHANLPQRKVAEPRVSWEPIRRVSLQPEGIRVWTDDPMPILVPLPEEHRHAPNAFISRHPYVEFLDDVPYRFSAGPGSP